MEIKKSISDVYHFLRGKLTPECTIIFDLDANTIRVFTRKFYSDTLLMFGSLLSDYKDLHISIFSRDEFFVHPSVDCVCALIWFDDEF